MSYPRIIAALQSECWAIMPAKLEAICAVVNDKLIGELAERRIAAGAEPMAARQVQVERSGATAVIPVMGTVAQRVGLLAEASGGVSTERIGAMLDAALADPDVENILLHIDSPGGSVYGVQELADKIRAARERKTIIAFADSLAASAAYWLGSQASEFVVTPGGEVGSIGVIALHIDQSQFNEQAGITPTFVYAGKYKADGNPHEPLSDSAREELQSRVDERYTAFLDAVAQGRGVSVGTVRNEFGEGRVVGARAAQAAGMVDRVDTLEGTLRRMRSKRAMRRISADITRAEIELAQSLG